MTMSFVEDIDIIFIPNEQLVPAGKTVEVKSPKKREAYVRLLGFKIWNHTADGVYAGFEIRAKGRTIYLEDILTRWQNSGDNQNHNSYIPFVDQWDEHNDYYGMCLSPPAGGLPLQEPRYFLRNTHETEELTIHYELWYQIIPRRR